MDFRSVTSYRREDLIRLAAADRRSTIGGHHRGRARLANGSGSASEIPIVDPIQRASLRRNHHGIARSSPIAIRCGTAELLDFEDLIGWPPSCIWQHERGCQPLHERIRFVFVDEYHDLSPEQFRLLAPSRPGRNPGSSGDGRRRSKPGDLGFRGGQCRRNVAPVPSDYRPDSNSSSHQNFRSTGRLVQSSNHLIRCGRGPANSLPDRPGTDTPFIGTVSQPMPRRPIGWPARSRPPMPRAATSATSPSSTGGTTGPTCWSTSC